MNYVLSIFLYFFNPVEKSPIFVDDCPPRWQGMDCGDRDPEVSIRKSDEGQIRVQLDHCIVFLPEGEVAIETNSIQLGQGMVKRVGNRKGPILIL